MNRQVVRFLAVYKNFVPDQNGIPTFGDFVFDPNEFVVTDRKESRTIVICSEKLRIVGVTDETGMKYPPRFSRFYTRIMTGDFQRPEDIRPNYKYKTTLIRELGWTNNLIREYLGEPDLYVKNPHYKSGPWSSLYDMVWVDHVTRTTDVATKLKTNCPTSATLRVSA